MVSREDEYFYKSIFVKASLSIILLDSEKVGPVEEVEDGKDAGEKNSGEHVNLFGSESEVVEPQRYPVGWYPEGGE